MYGFTITKAGRKLLASLVAGEPLTITGVKVGSGKLPDSVDPRDVTELVSPFANATTSTPIRDGEIVSFTVEYRSDLNGGLDKGRFINEYGVFAQDPEDGEILLYYANLGDYPEYVTAYDPRKAPTVRRFPVKLAVTTDAEVTFDMYEGTYLTHADAETLCDSLIESKMNKLENISKNIVHNITIPAEGWKENEGDTEYGYVVEVDCSDVTEDMVPEISLDKPSLTVAMNASVCPTIEACNTFVRLWAKEIPTEALSGTLVLIAPEGGKVTTAPETTYTVSILG